MLILVLLFIGALGVRVVCATVPTLDFHPARQYHSAIYASGVYVEAVDSVPQWERDIAAINKSHEQIFEPPIMEYLAAYAYRIAGGEHLWIPRLMSGVFWVLGGAFLYLIARKMTSIDAAVMLTALYLFLPYAVFAGTSFQPDPLMVMMILLSVFAIVRHHEQPTARRLIVAAALSSVAILVKPMSAFVVLGAFIALAASRKGILKGVIGRDSVVFTLVSLAPVFVYALYGYVIDGFLKGAEGGRFLAGLLLSPEYWSMSLYLMGFVLGSAAIGIAVLALILVERRRMSKPWMGVLFGGWAAFGIALIVTRADYLLTAALGYTAVVVSLLCIVMSRNRSHRALVTGLWLGYAVYCLVFTYHIHTHDYYHMPLIPIIALSLCPLLALVMDWIGRFAVRLRWRAATWAAVALVGVVWLIQALPSQSSAADYEDYVAMAREIGEYVGHSANTVFLAEGYGRPLRYHGQLYGYNWPHGIDFRQYELEGRPELTVEERFDSILGTPRDYFIVTDLEEFEEQADLRDFLTSRFTKLTESEAYVVFDLRAVLDTHTNAAGE